MPRKWIVAFSIIFLLMIGLHLSLRFGLWSEPLKRWTVSLLERHLKHRVEIGTARLNLVPTILILSDFTIRQKTSPEPLLHSEKVRITLSAWSLLTELTVIQKIKLKKPHIIISDQEQGIGPFISQTAPNQSVQDNIPQDALGAIIREVEIQEGSLAILQSNNRTRIETQGINGKIHPDLLMKNFRVRLKGQTTTFVTHDLEKHFDEWQIIATVQRNLIKIKKGEIVGPETHLVLSGSLEDWSAPRYTIAVDAAFPLSDIHTFIELNYKVTGQANLKGQLTGQRLSPSFNGDIKIRDLALNRIPIGHGRAALTYQDTRLRLSGFSSSMLGGKIQGDAVLDFETTPPLYQFSVALSKLSSGTLADLLGRPQILTTQSLDGQMTFSGQGLNRDSLSGKGTLKLYLPSDSAPPETVPVDWKGWINRIEEATVHFELHEGFIRIQDSRLKTPQSQISFQGLIDDQEELNLYFRLLSQQIHEFTPLIKMGFLEGALDLEGTLLGKLKDPQISANGIMQQAVIHNRPFEEIAGYFHFKYPKLSFTSVRLTENQATYDLDGSVSFDASLPHPPLFDLKANITNGLPRDVIAIFYRDLPITPSVSGDLTIQGHPREFKLIADLAVGSGTIYGQNVDTGRLKLTVTHESVSFEDVIVQYYDNTATGWGRIQYDGHFAMSVSSPQVDLANLVWAKKYLNHASVILAGDFEGEGLLHQPHFRWDGQIIEFTYLNQPFGKGKMTGSLTHEQLSLNVGLKNGFSGEGRLDLMDPFLFNIDVNLEQFQAKPFLDMLDFPYREALSAQVSGNVIAKGALRDITKLDSFIRVDQLTIDAGGYHLSNANKIFVDVNGPDVEIKSFQLEGKSTHLTIAGGLEILKNYDILIKGEADLDFLRAFSKEITYGQGKAQLALQILDEWKDPAIRGNLTIENGTLKIKTVDQAFIIRSMTVSFDQRQMILQSLEGEIGGGTLTANGKWDLAGLSVKQFSASLELTGGRITAVPGLVGSMDAALLFRGDGQDIYLDGEIRIERASYDRRLNWQKWVVDFTKSKKIETPVPSGFGGVLLNVQVIGEENIRINNNLAKIPLGINLLIKGTVNRPVLLGQIEAEKGTILFRRNEFRILSGTLDFVNPQRTDPILDIKATTRIRTRQSVYNIDLSLIGPIDHLDLTLISDPPLQNQEILALLTFGKTSQEIADSSTEIGAVEAAELFTGVIQEVFEEKVKTLTGVDRVQVDPYYSSTKAAGTPRLTVSKRLYEDRLYVTYQTTFDPSEEEVIQLEYIINNNVSLVGGQDERGQVGGDLKLRFQFR